MEKAPPPRGAVQGRRRDHRQDSVARCATETWSTSLTRGELNISTGVAMSDPRDRAGEAPVAMASERGRGLAAVVAGRTLQTVLEVHHHHHHHHHRPRRRPQARRQLLRTKTKLVTSKHCWGENRFSASCARDRWARRLYLHDARTCRSVAAAVV